MKITRVPRLLWLMTRRNGVDWTALFLAHDVARRLSRATEKKLRGIEQSRNVAGIHDLDVAREIWDTYDWGKAGEEWTPSEEWKAALVDGVLERWMPSGGVILEIGCGAGRWSEPLQRRATRLVLVDVSERCIELCRARFAGAANVEYYLNPGRGLPAFEAKTLDAVWSFDVFVHLGPLETEAYLRDVARLLKSGARAVIHHVGPVQNTAGWRSGVLAGQFASMAVAAGLKIVEQFDTWTSGGKQYDVKGHGDLISVLEPV